MAQLNWSEPARDDMGLPTNPNALENNDRFKS